MLDIIIVNTYYLSEHQRKAKIYLNTKDKVYSVHRAFRKALVLELLKDPLPKASKRPYIIHNTALPKIQLTRLIEIHQPRQESERALCFFYRWSWYSRSGITTKVITKSRNLNKTRTVCSYCNIALYTKYFYIFYYFKN